MKCLLNGGDKPFPCSRICPLYGDCVVEFNKQNKKPETNFDRIKSMSVDELVERIYLHDSIVDNICRSRGKCPFDDDVEPENCKECIKNWLEREVDPDD